jgi:hypothetical protein
MNKAQLLRRLDLGWRDFRAAYAGASEAELLQPRFDGDWSIRDLIAHVAIWEEEALKHMPLILAGEPEPRYSTMYGGIDAFNAAAMAAKQHLSLSDVIAEAQSTHERLVAFIEASAPEEQMRTDTRFRRRLRLDTYAHYALHAQMIREREGPVASSGTQLSLPQ